MNNSAKFVERATEHYRLPLNANAVVLHIENAIVKFGDTGITIDVGAYCYIKRDSARRGRGSATRVDPTSLSKSRKKQMTSLVRIMSDQLGQGNSPGTVHARARDFLHFLTRCDSMLGYDVLSSPEYARSAVEEFILSLKEDVRSGRTNKVTAVNYQRHALHFVSELCHIRNISEGLTLMTTRASDVSPTEPPRDNLKARQLALNNAIFDGLSHFILDNQEFPFKLQLPNYLNWKSNYLWLFPTNGFFRTPQELSHPPHKVNNFAIDFENGLIRPPSEIIDKYSARHAAATTVKNINNRIKAANNDPRHPHRIELAPKAYYSFLDLFLANTGMTWKEATQLPWSDDYTITTESVIFRTIKYRAQNKEVSFAITSAFIPKFKRYLALRKFIIGERDSSYLFPPGSIRFNSEGKTSLVGILKNMLTFNRRIDPDFEPISAREWRAAKSNRLVDKHGLAVAATALQSTEAVVGRSYSAGTASQTTIEVGNYFSELISAVVKRRVNKVGIRESAVGECKKQHSPTPIIENPPVTPDCNQPEGCLFCDKHYVISDEKDVRKLASCRFCVLSTKSLSKSDEEWCNVFSSVLERIDGLLSQISSLSSKHKSLVSRITEEVQDGKLDKYWERKMLMLSNLAGNALW